MIILNEKMLENAHVNFLWQIKMKMYIIGIVDDLLLPLTKDKLTQETQLKCYWVQTLNLLAI